MNDSFNEKHRVIGITSTLISVFLLMAYIPVTTLGLLSLESPQAPIADPYFTMMELIILLLAPLLVVNMVVVHAYAKPKDKTYGLIAIIFMIIMATITSCVHFAVLTVSRQIEAIGFSWAPLLFSFKWPSVVYALDILAWDWFFALSMLFGALVFGAGRLENSLRMTMIVSGVSIADRLNRRTAGEYEYQEYRHYRIYCFCRCGIHLMAVVFKRRKVES